MASQPRYDEGLEVAPAGSGPSAYYDQQQKQVTEFYGGAQKQVPEFYGGAQNGKEVVPNADNEKYYNGNTGDEKEEKKRICGLSALVFWILVVVAVLVVAGAVGGGVAGAMASKSSRNTNTPIEQTTPSPESVLPTTSPISESIPPTTTSTRGSTSTSASTSASPTSTEFPDDAGCPQTNGTTITSRGSTFVVLCDTNIIGINARVIDLGSPARTASLRACAERCLQWNEDRPTDNKCVAASWAVNIPDVTPLADRNVCWIKLATSFQVYDPDKTEGLGSASAILVGG